MSNQPIKEYILDFVHFFYPVLCDSCKTPMMKNEKHLCLSCHMELPLTQFKNSLDNEIVKLMWGRVPIKYANSLLYFKKNGMAQTLMHEIKYKGNQELAVYLGELLAQKLAEEKLMFDMIIPVPLHTKKLKKRGFNQSVKIAEGYSKISQIPVELNGIIRVKNTETQTKKKRYERWENTDGKFLVTDSDVFKNKRVVLIDDVITTGATIEACCNELTLAGVSEISIFTMCYATF